MMRITGGVLLLLLFAFALSGLAQAESDARDIIVVDITTLEPAERIYAASLQGIANQGDDLRVFLQRSLVEAEWLDYTLRIEPAGVRRVALSELERLVRPQLRGQVIYDSEAPFTVDIATSLAGINRLAVTDRDRGLVTEYDLRGRWTSASEAYNWAVANVLPQCTPRKAALIGPDDYALRDYAIKERIFTISSPTNIYDDAFQGMLLRLQPGTALWGAGTRELIGQISSLSHYLVAAEGATNLSYFATITVQPRYYQYARYVEPVAPRYLTIIFDCSDIGFTISELPSIWADTERAERPLGWAISPPLLEAAGPIVHHYYADAYWSGNDHFVIGPNGTGRADVNRMSAPHEFLRQTREQAGKLGLTAGIHDLSYGMPNDPASYFLWLAAETRMRGFFISGVGDFAPTLYDDIPVIAAPRFTSSVEAVNYINQIPVDRRCVAIILDPRQVSTADAAHIAEHVADRYVVIPPNEMVEMMRAIAWPETTGQAMIAVTAVDYEEPANPEDPFTVTARVEPADRIATVAAVYRGRYQAARFAKPMERTSDGRYSTLLPPYLQGGELEIRIRARDITGATTWSPPWTIQVARADSDGDGLSDAEEAFLLTDPNNKDTDGDGMIDGIDPAPLYPNRDMAIYAGPIGAPGETPYLLEGRRTRQGDWNRIISPGESVLYEIPLPLLPPEAQASLAINGEGPIAISVGGRPDSLASVYQGRLERQWKSEALAGVTNTLYARVSCPVGEKDSLSLESISVTSSPTGPYLTRSSHYPRHPGPEQSITASIMAYSPRGIETVRMSYRINNGGVITIPMEQAERRHLYRGRLPALANRDSLEYWITATDGEGSAASTNIFYTAIGSRSRDVISLLARRDFLGDWVIAPQWGGLARAAHGAGREDIARVRVNEGMYTFWVLAGGRGRGFEVYLGRDLVGAIGPNTPDGWHRVGRRELDGRRHEIRMVSSGEAETPPGASPCYAELILSADPTFSPPVNRILDFHNSLALLSPPPEAMLTGRIDVIATGAGNVTAVEFLLDGEMLGRALGPPFELRVNAERLPAGPRSLKAEAHDRAGPLGLSIEIPVTIIH